MATFVFFGASGDLFTKKLAPAYGRLIREGSLPTDSKLLGISRQAWSDNDFRDALRHHAPDIPQEGSSFISADIQDPALPEQLAKALTGQQAIFYLALPPTLYAPVLKSIKRTYEVMGASTAAFRILLEKPFGRNMAEALELDQVIDATVGEERIFRIDHYIQKESVQNILAYRFSNELFSGVWNEKATAHIHAFLREAHTITGRGEFYDSVGTLNDVVQNHVLQMLAAATMESPKQFLPANVRAARADVFKRLRVAPSGHLRGQYQGYTETQGVSSDSQTETYVRIQAFLEDPHGGENVPVVLEAGKALPERHSGVRMYLKQSGTRVCFDEPCDHENVLEFLLAPEEKTVLNVWGKKPGLKNQLMPHKLSFSFSVLEGALYADRAYDRVLYDAWRENPTYFVSRDEIEAAWRFADDAREALLKVPLIIYPQGILPA